MNEVVNRILDLSKSYQEADFLPNIFGRFGSDAISGNVPVVLFGAGSAGKELYPLFRQHGVNPVCFCDNNPERQRELCCGIQVISPDELRRAHRNSLIIITPARHCHEIKMQLIDQGFLSDKVLCINEDALTLYYSHICLSHWTYDDLMIHEDNLLAAYGLMYDDNSKQFLINYLSILTHGSDYSSFCKFMHQSLGGAGRHLGWSGFGVAQVPEHPDSSLAGAEAGPRIPHVSVLGNHPAGELRGSPDRAGRCRVRRAPRPRGSRRGRSRVRAGQHRCARPPSPATICAY